jgi:hypothetical protein
MRFDWKPWMLAACLCSLGCADFKRGPGPRDAAPEAAVQGDVTLVEDLTFETDVYRILQIRCEDCHKSGGMGGYTRFVLTGNARIDRAMVMALVTPGDPAASLLLARATGDSHTGGQVLVPDSDPYNTIANWISLLPLP